MYSHQKHRLNMNLGRCITKKLHCLYFPHFVAGVWQPLCILALVHGSGFQIYCSNALLCFSITDKAPIPQLKHFTPLQMHLGFLLPNVGQVSTNKSISILTNLNFYSHWHMYQYWSYWVIRVKIPFRCATNNNNPTSVSPL